MTFLNHYINNQWHPSSGEEFCSTNPATLEELWSGTCAEKAEVDAAVEAARGAFEGWAALPIEKRIEFAEAFQTELMNTKDEFAEVISKETGKPLWESKAEINAMIGKVKISKEAFFHRCQEIERGQGMYLARTRHKPHGVLAVFGPFNFPGHLPNGHIIPALIAGNTIVLKPSALTPLVTEKMINIWENCHLPKGVINMIQGDVETGRLLAEHRQIDGLLFTGSFETGQHLSKIYGKWPEKILALEMGGNNPYVIGNITDNETAAYLALHSAYITSGQRCTCARRLIISSGPPGDQFLEAFLPMIHEIHVGPYTNDPEPYMGPVISEESATHLLERQADMLSKGAEIIVEMKPLKGRGVFLSPGLIDVTFMEKRTDEELFGPLLQVIRVPDFDAAIKEANNTSYGLAAGLLSDDKDQFHEFYNKVRAGVINWNAPLTGASSQSPFGGVGHSGNHRPSAYYAADYCSYPVATLELDQLKMPQTFPPGLSLPHEEEQTD